MQFLEDDSDELFRKAAKDYPLDTGSADWNKVWTALKEKNNKRGGRNNFFGLLLLLIFAWSANTFVGHIQFNQFVTVSPNDRAGNQKQQAQAIPRQLENNNEPASHNNKKITVLTTTYPSINYPVKAVAKGNDAISASVFKIAIPNPEVHVKIKRLDQSFSTNGKGESSTAVIKSDIPSDSSSGVIVNTKPNRKGIYVGVIAGVDKSLVKFQKTSKTGYSAGIVIGYAFKNKWSLESGILFDQKSYFSDGKYFNPKLYTAADIKTVDGTCKMIELPITARFSFTKKGNWFAAAGISSYFMKEENYEYVYQVVGSQLPLERYKTYRNSEINWFSIMHVSIGYSKKIGSIGTIRIEPYAKLPFTGLGIGKLPITSVGVNIGLTRQLSN